MAVMDNRLLFGTDYNLAQAAGNYLFTNQVNLGAAGEDIGQADRLFLNIVVTEAFTDGASTSTLTLKLMSDDSATINATTGSVHFVSEAYLKAKLTLGAKISIPVPLGNLTAYEQYLGLYGIIGTAAFTAGKMTAWLGREPVAGWKATADATN